MRLSDALASACYGTAAAAQCQERRFEGYLLLVPANRALLYIRVASGCKVTEGTPSVLQLLQAAWSWSEGKSVKYIQHLCPYFQVFIILINTFCPFQNHLSTKMLLLPAWNCPLQVTSEWKGQSLLWSFERQDKEYRKAFLFHACSVII